MPPRAHGSRTSTLSRFAARVDSRRRSCCAARPRRKRSCSSIRHGAVELLEERRVARVGLQRSEEEPVRGKYLEAGVALGVCAIEPLERPCPALRAARRPRRSGKRKLTDHPAIMESSARRASASRPRACCAIAIPMERKSFFQRALRSSPSKNSSGSTLTATSRPRRGSLARDTSPIPPAPRRDRISYGPRRARREAHEAARSLSCGNTRQAWRVNNPA